MPEAYVVGPGGIVQAKRHEARRAPRRNRLPLALALFTAVLLSAPAAWAQGACCTSSSCLPTATESQCAGQGGVFLPGETCGSSPCGVGACCFDLSCNTANAFDCITAGREYAGAGTTCLQDPCGANVGACCLGGGACSDISPADCGTAGGTWLGAGTNCAGGLCQQGECCSPGVCEAEALYECNASQGAFVPGGDCLTHPCVVPGDCALNSLVAQSPDTPAGFTAYVSENAPGLLRRENFEGAAGSIETLTWWGFEVHFNNPGFTECNELNPTFQVTFHESVAGEPGPVVCSYTLAATVTSTGTLYQGLELNQYKLTLPTPCVLPEGWVGLVGLGSPDCWFAWISASEGDGFSYCQGCQSPIEDDNLAYCIGGTYGGLFGACCDQSTGLCVDAVEIPDCTAPGQHFTQDTACAELDPACSQVTGGCCFQNGACDSQLPSDCVAAGGDWLGANASCDLCPKVGACCFDQNSCDYQTQAACDAQGSTWLGLGSSCVDCSPPPECSGNSLFSQNPDGPSDFLANTSEESSNLRRSEDFTGVAGAVDSVTWWGLDLDAIGGGNWAECVEADPTFRISFHEDAGGAPGAEVCSYVVPASYTPTGLMYLGTELNAYSVTLPTPCVLVNGWISIVGLGDPECWFLWMGSDTASGAGYSWCDHCLPSQQDIDLNICLGGSPGGVTGACCDDTTASCQDGIDITNCANPYPQRFSPGQSCAALDPPCGTVIGACCKGDATCSIETEAACQTEGGNWLGANKLCDQCPCVTPCPSGSTSEGEPVCADDYVDTFDGGCFSGTPTYRPIALNETVCGDSGVFHLGVETKADWDWYQVQVAVNTNLTWNVKAEFRPRAWIIDGSGGCSGAPILTTAEALECDDLSITAAVDPGTYWLVVGPAGFSDTAVCGASYTAELRNTPPPLVLKVSPTALTWTGTGPRYDIVRGDLGTLHSNGGNFTAAVTNCLANDKSGTSLPYTVKPTTPGQGHWFLVRPVAPSGPGSYDSGGPGQVGSRDAEINASPLKCP